MKPYIVKFSYHWEDSPQEEMALCLHADTPDDARERFVQVTGGQSRNCYLISVTGANRIEMMWSAREWTFVPKN